jgi:hypothetical protein
MDTNPYHPLMDWLDSSVITPLPPPKKINISSQEKFVFIIMPNVLFGYVFLNSIETK